MFTILDYSSVLEYSIIRRYTNIVYYYYYIMYFDAVIDIVNMSMPCHMFVYCNT